MHKHRGYSQPQEKSMKIKTNAGWSSPVVGRMEEARDSVSDDEYGEMLERAKNAQ